MLVERYETGGAVIEVYDDDYANQEKEELQNRQQNFLKTAQRLHCHDLKENSSIL